MNQKTLLAIGRRHTPEEVAEAFSSARAAGFDNINMDLIAGLPGETAGMFAYTLDEVLKLDPESITVHTLSLKRGSKLKEWAREGKEEAQEESQAADMHHTAKRLKDTFYLPITSTAKKYEGEPRERGLVQNGKDGVYNIAAMEETETLFRRRGGGV
jgi:oxygen-independent coproporphyrinogen-3 oxidase